jgi:hypothetical protein
MVTIESIDIQKNKISLKVNISKKDYGLISKSAPDIVILPTGGDHLSQKLTTGKIGNGNRIMIPKKFLERKNISNLPKIVDSDIFQTESGLFLLIKLRDDHSPIPSFSE